MKLTETTLLQNTSKNLFNNKINVDPNEVPFIIDSLIASFGEFLGMNKIKDGKVGLALEDLKGNFKMGGIVGYTANEDADMPGSWWLELTFDGEDLKDVTTKFKTTDTTFQTNFTNVCHKLHHMYYQAPELIQTMIITVVDSIISWLDENAKENEEVTLELPNYFVATVAVENGEKIMSITPDGNIKRLVKDDELL